MRCFKTLPFPIAQSENLDSQVGVLRLFLLLYHIPHSLCEREFTLVL